MIAAFGVSLLAVAGFMAALVGSRLIGTASGAIETAASGAAAVLDRALSDDEKEAAVQRAGLGLLKGAFGIAWRIALCLAAAAAPIYALDAIGAAPADAVLAMMLRLDYIVGVSLGVIALIWLWKRLRPGKPDASLYSGADQLTHRLAFSGPGVQIAAANAEGRLFRKRLAEVADAPPVFVAGLPRAGTTVIMTALSDLEGLATHTYRDMPLPLAPLLWSRLTGAFRKRGEMRERAHGDGVAVGFDSPEAFEEVYWRAFWRGKFHDDRIDLWSAADRDEEAEAFLRRMFRALVALRAGGKGRYLSKNNGNIGRLALLPAIFPDAALIVPFRDPAEHAASLLRQHLNFLSMQREDPFVARYMADIGHLEFGALHRPFDFPGRPSGDGAAAESADYWLSYWIAAYRDALGHAGRVHLVGLEQIGAAPDKALGALCERIGVGAAGADFGARISAPRATADRAAFSPALLEEAMALHRTLVEKSPV